jgi:hypothetical protein
VRVLAVVLLALAVASPAQAAQARLTEREAIAPFLRHPKVADWLDRYPAKGRVTDASYDSESGSWTVHVWWEEAGEIATGKVNDSSGRVTEAWTGPQVAWKMARGYDGAFGGKSINRLDVWLVFCAVFLLGLVDWRRPLGLRTLDLVALLSFSVSLWFFNRGDVFTAMPLVYPALAYLLGRMIWIGARGRGGRARRSGHLVRAQGARPAPGRRPRRHARVGGLQQPLEGNRGSGPEAGGLQHRPGVAARGDDAHLETRAAELIGNWFREHDP